MSGPKLLELRRMRAARERQLDHDRCAGFGSEYSRLLEEFNEWARRLAKLSVPVAENVRPLERVRAEIDALLLQGSHHEAARIFGEEVSRLRGLVEQQQAQFEQRMLNLQNRHQQLLQNREAISAARSQLAGRLKTAVPAGWPEPDRTRVQNLVEEALKNAGGPEAPGFPSDPQAIADFEKAEGTANAALTTLQSAQQRLETELSSIPTKLLTGSLAAGAPTSPSLAEVLQRLAPRPVSPEDKQGAEIDRVLAELAALSDDDFLQDARQKAASLRGETDPARRRMLTEGLLLDGGARLRTLRQRAGLGEQARKLIDSVAHLADPAINDLVSELRRMVDSEDFRDLESVRLRLPAAMAAAEARREREYKRRALIDALKGIGYETNEGLETAFVKDGRLVLRRPGEDDYAVEMVANPDLTQLQTALVRFADSAEVTEQQRRRDMEREESWCQDHARLREQMAARGLETGFKMQLKPGEHPVKVLVDAEAASSRRSSAEAPLKKFET